MQARVPVRLKSLATALIAVQQTDQTEIEIDGRPVRSFPGDFQVFSGEKLIDVVSPTTFAKHYERTDQGGLTLSASDQAKIAAAIGQPAAESADRLVSTVERLAKLKIGEVKLDFSPAQWEELKNRAQKRGQPLDIYLQLAMDRFFQDLWTQAGV